VLPEVMDVLKRSVVASVVGLVTAASGVVTAWAAPPGRTGDAAALTVAGAAWKAGTAAWASARAQALGEDVAVEEEMSERRDVYAQPDGTFRATLWTDPVRVRSHGSWVSIDTTLSRRPDGTVGPAATETPTTFSGGGTQPLVRLGDDTEQLTLTWPGSLPVPILTGDTATYPEVFPGVDLRLTATETGYRKALVVKTRAAAANPALSVLRLGVAVQGAQLRGDEHGNIGAFDDQDVQVFAFGAPQMWDSAPVPRFALSQVSLDGASLVLVPDRALLDDPQTVYPVTIDPEATRGRTGFTTVVSGAPDRGYWGGHAGRLAKVGQCYNGNGECNGIGIARSYFNFNVEFFRPKIIISTAVNIFLDYSPSCSARVVTAQSTTPVSASTTWRRQPTLRHTLSSLNIAYGYNSTCSPRSVGFPAGALVTDGLVNGGTATVLLRASNESDQLAWKKFRSNPYLEINYNTRPNAPVMRTVENRTCALSPNQPHVNPLIDNDPRRPRGPKFVASASDADGGTLTVEFELLIKGGAALSTVRVGPKASGSQFSVDVPSAHAVHLRTLTMRARAFDGRHWGNWSSFCDVTVDRVGPMHPPKVSSTMYPECRLFEGDCPISGGVGRTGTFTFSPGCDPNNATVCDSDVAGYKHGPHDQPVTHVAGGTGAIANALVTPVTDLDNYLYVRSVDKAGNVGPIYVYEYWVGAGSGPRGRWRLDGITETTAVEDSAARHDGPVTLGPTTWKAGRSGDALWFNGTTGYVSTTNGPTVRTDASFSVAAWVKLDSLDSQYRTAVSQEGSGLAAFYLSYNGGTRKWNFTMPAGSTPGATSRISESAQPVVPGRWTHLVGTYDVAAKQLRIHVDGVPGTAVSHTTPWHAAGTVQFGRGRVGAAQTYFWLGSLDDVRIYDRLLAEGEIRDLANSPAVEELFLPMEDGTGARVSDVSGNYRIGTLTGSGSWTDGVTDPNDEPGAAVRLDGSTATIINTGRPAVRTDASFTVTAWVRPTTGGAAWQTILSQDGVQVSGFELGYRGDTGQFAFKVPRADSTTAVVAEVIAPEPAFEDAWVEVAGVYDATVKQIRLYVAGELKGSVAAPATFNATGAFVVGRGKRTGAYAPFTGSIDDVHAWTGARTDDQIDGARPVRLRNTPYTGVIGRFYHVNQHHIVTNGPVPPGSHFERSFGLPAPSDEDPANTYNVVSCRRGDVDYYLAHDSCQANTLLGVVGKFYRTPPAGVPTMLVYRCLIVAKNTHFVSADPNCEGQTSEIPLGYTRAVGKLVRHVSSAHPHDQSSSTSRVPSDYRAEGGLGLLSMVAVPAATPLMSCRDGNDTFSSPDPTCEGKTVVGSVGHVWTSPPGDPAASRELLRCRTETGERFDSLDPGCEGRTRDRSLGYVITAL
jgi:hypothetical protein